MNAKDRELILDFKKRLPSEITSHLRRLVIFGSRARRQADEDSDLDLLVLVDEKTPEIEKILEDIAYAVMWDNDFEPIISLKVFSDLQYKNALNKELSFYRNIEHEGITL